MSEDLKEGKLKELEELQKRIYSKLRWRLKFMKRFKVNMQL